MNKLTSLLAMALLTLGLSAQAQTNTPTIQGGVQEIVNAMETGRTNWYFTAGGLYAPSLNKHYGGYVGAFYPLSTYVVTGMRLDYVDGGFWMPQGSATFQVPVKIFSWLTVTPFGYIGIGVPVSGATYGDWTVPGNHSDNNGQATAIAGYGGAVHVYSKGNLGFDLIADREKWSGFDGYQFRFGALVHYLF